MWHPSFIEHTPCAHGSLGELLRRHTQSHDHQKPKTNQKNDVNTAPLC